MSAFDFDFDQPYPSRRAPIMAQNIVATSQPLAAQAGLDMLRRGGNAMDAAVATAIALTVVEPTSNGIGSDAFALIWTGGGLHGLNASGRSPAGLSPDRFDGRDAIPYRGWDGVTTPGAVSGWAHIASKYGRLPLSTLCEPAVRYARDGFLVSPEVAYYWNRGAAAYQAEEFASWRETFERNGRPPSAGERFVSTDHADTLEEIGATDGESFYRGRLAERIARAASDDGGLLSAADLDAHEPMEVRPISMAYHGFRLHEIPPNGQGIAALIALGILKRFDMRSLAVDSAETIHLQIEAMKLAFADAHRYVADPEHLDVDPNALLDVGYLEERARLIDRSRAGNFAYGTPKPGGTVLLTTADAEGNMVSFIQSNYTGFGSGIVVPGTGIALQNRACCFTLEPSHPNRAGPSKRPYHTIIPGFVTRDTGRGAQTPLMAFGVMGGFMQPQGHLQVLMRIADHRQNPQAALDAPRWQVGRDGDITIEPGLEPATYDRLRALGHDLRVHDRCNASFGRGQAIYRVDHGYIAGSEQRSDGQAVGF